MEIVKQIDSSDIEGVRDDVVAFVEVIDVYRGRGLREWTEHRYSASLHKRPIGQQSFICGCPHEHRGIDAAKRCALRLLRMGAKAEIGEL